MNNSKGTIKAINISLEKGTIKTPVDSALFVVNHGIEGDAHAADWHRQVSLLADESVDKMRAKGATQLKAGDFAENLTLSGFDLNALKVGEQVKIGGVVVLEITQIGKECHGGCEIKKITGDCVMPREGYFAKVLVGGTVKTGDVIEVTQ